MKIRAIFLAVLLLSSIGGVYMARRSNLVSKLDQTFLDFLVAYGRESLLQGLPTQSQDVVLVEFKEEDKAEYSAWPPAPLDYIMAMKRLQPHEPELVAFTTPLRWSQEQMQFAPELRDRLLQVPSLVLSYDLQTTSPQNSSKEETDFFKDQLPSLGAWKKKNDQGLHFQGVSALPEKILRAAAQLGFLGVSAEKGDAKKLPLVATDGQHIVPSLTTQAATLLRHVPYAELRLRFGAGARLSLEDRYMIPLDRGGALQIADHPEVPRVNALDLMTPDLGDATDTRVAATLGQHKSIFFVLANQEAAQAHARALAMIMALPEVHRCGALVISALVAAIFLLGMWQLHYGRTGALAFGFSVGVAGMLASMLMFPAALIWCPPSFPLAVLCTSTLFCFLFPHRAKLPVAAPKILSPLEEA